MDLLADLNEPQRIAVMHRDGPLLVLAGAGSGKTRVITRRVAYMIEHGVPAWNVLAITFTNKAAAEMRERVAQLGATRGATVCTFHSLCARLLREFAAEAGLDGNFSIYDRDDQLKITKEAVTAVDLATENFPPSKVHAIISSTKNEMKTPQALMETADTFYMKNIAKVYAKYEQLLAASNAVDFDDLLLRVAFLLRDRQDIRQVLGRRYQYVMIDEYQDTNHAQYVLAHGIAMEHENICATGDPDQSIYAWRGADINNILEFEQDYPNATVVRLEENYRSTAPILAAASSLIAHNKQRKDKTLWTRKEGGANVRIVYCDHEHAESALVARRIAAFHAGGGKWDDIAVFYRVNSLSRVMEEAFLRAGIPYRIARGTEFYNRKEIKDVLAYLKLLVNTRDDLSCSRIINTPPRGIGATTINRITAYGMAHGLGLLDACRQAAQAGLGAGPVAKVANFVSLIDALRTGLDRPAKAVMEDVLSKSGLDNALAGADEDQKQARANVDELISTAAEFDINRAAGSEESDATALEEYLHQISLVSDVDHFEGGGGAVTLMTMHAAKGLEFPAVFIIGCEMGLLPFQRADENTGWGSPEAFDKLEEERRLAFVGMTRAEQQLTLTCARQRKIRGQDVAQAASMFLGEIGTDFVQVEDACTGAAATNQYRSQFRGGFYADTRDRAAIEEMEGTLRSGKGITGEDIAFDDMEVPLPPEYEHLRAGCQVASSKFGRGKVISLSQPWPHTRVKVNFGQYGEKTLVLAMAKLELL